MPRLLLLHGLGASSASWSRVASEWDGPVHAPRLPWTWATAREWGSSPDRDIDEIVDLVEPGDIMVAHSFAGTLAILAAAAQPDRMPAAIVLVAPFHLGHGNALEWDEARRLFDDFESILAEGLSVSAPRPLHPERFMAMARAARDAIGPMGWGRFMHAYAETAKVDLGPLAGRVAMIHGSRDTAAPPEGSTRLRGDLPGSLVYRLPDVGHFPMVDDPVGFRDALHLAVAGLTRSRVPVPA